MFEVRRIVSLAALLLLGMSGPVRAECQMNRVAGLHLTTAGFRIFVPVTVNGREVLFQVDTGASQSWILHAGADALGAKVLMTTGGRLHDDIHFMTARIGSASIGAWTKGDFDIAVHDGPGDLGLPHAIGVLGQDVLRGFDIEVNVKDGAFNLFAPQGCEAANLAYWSEAYNVVGMQEEPHRRQVRPHAPHAMAKINGQDMLASFSTAIGYSGLYVDSAERAGVKPDSPGVIQAGEIRLAGGQSTPIWRGSFASFSLDQEEIKPAVLSFNERIIQRSAGLVVGGRLPRGAYAYDMVLGADFISAHRMLFSNSQQKIYFTYAGGVPFYRVEGPVLDRNGDEEE